MNEQSIRLLDELGAEFARVAADHKRSRRARTTTRRRALAIALSAVVVLSGGAYAVPGTRAAIDDITASFAGWVAGDDEQAPGRALRPEDDAPDWIRAKGGRLIAETGGVGLYVSRQGDYLDFALDEGVYVGDSIEGWRKRFDDHAIVVLGPTLVGRGQPFDERGRFPLLGVTARSVERIELRYASGPPLEADRVKGGFVLLADARRALRELVAYDRGGRELEHTDVSYISDWRAHCIDPRGCPPGRWERIEP